MTDLTIPLWIIAVCAVIWTVRMLLNAAVGWLALRYHHYTHRPAPVRWLGGLLDGGRWD